MNIRLLVFAVAALAAVSCRKPTETNNDRKTSETQREKELEKREEENERQPREDEIAEHCLAFLRSTKVVSAQSPRADCPGCAAEGGEVLAFQQMKTDRISCSADTCEVTVTIRASFRAGTGETITGGLTAWIPKEQRDAYLRGHPPEGEQVFPVKIIYKRTGGTWRAVEFDRADPPR